MRYTTLLALIAPLAALAAPPAQIYLSPAPATTDGGAPISLSAPQANAVLAHHLGVAQYERLPTNKGDRTWEQALGSNEWSTGGKMVILMECSKDGCDGTSPHARCCHDADPVGVRQTSFPRRSKGRHRTRFPRSLCDRGPQW